MSDSLVDDTRS